MSEIKTFNSNCIKIKEKLSYYYNEIDEKMVARNDDNNFTTEPFEYLKKEQQNIRLIRISSKYNGVIKYIINDLNKLIDIFQMGLLDRLETRSKELSSLEREYYYCSSDEEKEYIAKRIQQINSDLYEICNNIRIKLG